MPAKRLKNSHPLQTVTFKISLAGEGNQNTKRKTKIMYSVALTMTYLAAENENQKLKDLSQNDFVCVPKNILSIAEEKVTI